MFIKRRLRGKEGQGHQRDTTIHCLEQMGLMECYVWDVRGFDGYGNCLTRVREALDPHDGWRREKGEKACRRMGRARRMQGQKDRGMA